MKLINNTKMCKTSVVSIAWNEDTLPKRVLLNVGQGRNHGVNMVGGGGGTKYDLPPALQN